MDLGRCLADEFQSALHDKFICQRVEDLELHIMFILHSHFVSRNQYTFEFLPVDGRRGLEQDRSKAMDLYLRSYEQGSPEAADRLSYYNGSFWNRGEKLKYLKEGARLGNTNLCIELGVMGTQTGIIDVEESLKLIMTAAKAGDDEAMGFCWKFFRSGHLKKQDLETTMRAKQAALDEVNNEDRDFAKRFGAFRAKLDSRYN